MDIIAIVFLVGFVLIFLISFAFSVLGKLFGSNKNEIVDRLIDRVARIEKRLFDLQDKISALSEVKQQPAAQKPEEPEPEIVVIEAPAPLEPAKPVEKVAETSPIHVFNETVRVVEAYEAEKSLLNVDISKVDTDTLERYIGQRVIGWAAVALAVFAIGFFVKYAYEKGWIIPEGRVAIGEIVGLGLIYTGWRQHRKGNPLGSQMLMGCGIGACYLATYAAFGFYDLISQPMAGLFMTIVLAAAGWLAVTTNAFTLGMVTVLGGLLTPLLLYSTEDQHVSLFLYLTLLCLSTYLLHLWKPWDVLRSLVWMGAIIHYGLWYFSQYSVGARIDCFVFFAVLWLIPLVQILLRGRKTKVNAEDSILFELTPLIVFFLVDSLLHSDLTDWQGKLAFALSLVYAVLTWGVWHRRRFDPVQYQLPLSSSIIFLALAIALELSPGWIGIGWVTQGVVLWGLGLRHDEKLVRFFGIITLLIGTGRILLYDINVVDPNTVVSPGTIPFFNSRALPGIWLSAGWVIATMLAFRFAARLAQKRQVGIHFGTIACWIIWVVLTYELFPHFPYWRISSRWLAAPWMLLAVAVYWGGCRLPAGAWRISGALLMLFAVIRSLVGDLPIRRYGEFVPLLNMESLPVLFTAALLLACRPMLVRYEPLFLAEEKHLKPVTGLTGLAMIFLILSLDVYQFCRMQFPTYQLLPDAALSVTWSLFGALLLSIGFWKKLSTLRWAAIGIFAMTLAKVLLIDLGWLSGLYRILALLLIALVLASVTWTYQRKYKVEDGRNMKSD